MELLNAAISMVNLPYTVFMGIVALYWSSVILGAMDISFLDMDIDIDADVDGDLPFHLGLLTFFNVGQVPTMFLLSILGFFSWSFSILVNHALDNESMLVAAGLFFPNMFVSLFVTKYITKPFAKLFNYIGKETSHTIIGSLVQIRSKIDHQHISQIEVKTDGSPLLINARAREGVVLDTGQQVMVVDKEDDIYIVEAFDEWERD